MAFVASVAFTLTPLEWAVVACTILNAALFMMSLYSGKNSRPSKAMWVGFTSISVPLAATMYLGHVLNVQIALVAVCDVIITILVMVWYGKPGWSSWDKFCLVLTGACVICLVATRDPLLVMWCFLGANTVSASAGWVERWQHPRTERPLAFAFTFLGAVFQVWVHYPNLTLNGDAQPFDFMLTNGVMLLLIIVPWRPSLRIRSA